MANVDTFPLLKLPYLPLANVIQQFHCIQIRVHLATLSKRTAILAKSLRDIKVLGLKLTVTNILILSVIQLTDGTIGAQGWMYEPNRNTPDFPFFVDYNHLQKLINTMFFIFGPSGFAELAVNWQEDRTLKMVSRLQNLLRNLNTIKFKRNYSSEFYKQVLAAFPSVRNVSMMGKPNNQIPTEKLEIMEFSSLCLYDPFLVDCVSLQINSSVFIYIDLDQFVSSWIQGRMPRLKHARFQKLTPLRQHLIFDGIESEKADQNRTMTFKSYSLNLGDSETIVVQGGVDIESENGARATITVKDEGNRFVSWNMNVWD